MHCRTFRAKKPPKQSYISLSSLRVERQDSSLKFYRVGSDGRPSELWAILRFASYESTTQLSAFIPGSVSNPWKSSAPELICLSTPRNGPFFLYISINKSRGHHPLHLGHWKSWVARRIRFIRRVISFAPSACLSLLRIASYVPGLTSFTVRSAMTMRSTPFVCTRTATPVASAWKHLSFMAY